MRKIYREDLHELHMIMRVYVYLQYERKYYELEGDSPPG